MKRKIIIMFSVLCILAIAVVVSEAILYFKTQPPSPSPLGPPAGQPNPTEQPSPSPLSPPAELSTNFDPTKNTPRFMIESADKHTETFSLRFVWPHQLEGKKITSRIACKNGDIKIVNPIDSAGEDVTIETLINKVQETASELMIFSGLCGDNSCAEINKACQLYVAKNK